MATRAQHAFLPTERPWTQLGRFWRHNPPLAFAGIIMIGVLVATLVGMIVDPRLVLNEPAWLKPAKFAISISIYSFTLLWLMTFIQPRRRLVTVASWVVAGALVLEQVIISFQALRGVRSHFNFATAFDSMLFGLMGAAIVVLWLANLAVAILLLRQRFASPAMAWALRFGLVIALVGMAVAFFMPQPTPAQVEAMRATGGSDYIGAHSVGVEDGGPGLPIVGWSTTGGDLRVPHFVGIHALQAMPIVAWLLLRIPGSWLTVPDRTRLIIIAGLGGLGFVSLLTWQALRGQSLIAPDAQTLTAFLGGAVVAGLATVLVVVVARRRVGEVVA